jgi:hypothetical protein
MRVEYIIERGDGHDIQLLVFTGVLSRGNVHSGTFRNSAIITTLQVTIKQYLCTVACLLSYKSRALEVKDEQLCCHHVLSGARCSGSYMK